MTLQALFKLLGPGEMAAALVTLAGHLSASTAPRHRLQRLASVRTTLALMGGRVAEPALARWVGALSLSWIQAHAGIRDFMHLTAYCHLGQCF